MAQPAGLDKIYTYIKTLVTGMEVIPTAEALPSFKELKESPEKFYELFSTAVYKYNTICDALQKLQHANAMLVKVVNDLTGPECPQAFVSKAQYMKSFTTVKAECTALISAYETAKASAEAIVKYFNSAQYVITSNRFDATSAVY